MPGFFICWVSIRAGKAACMGPQRLVSSVPQGSVAA